MCVLYVYYAQYSTIINASNFIIQFGKWLMKLQQYNLTYLHAYVIVDH